MEFPFQLTPEGLRRIANLTHTYSSSNCAETAKTKQYARDLKSLSYVLLHEAMRTHMPGQAQLDAYNNAMDFEFDKIVREHEQPINVSTINSKNNSAIQIVFSDISIEAPTHTEPDGTRIHLLPKDVSKRRIPYDISMCVDLKLTQTLYDIVPPMREYGKDGKAFYAPCLIVADPYNFNGWGMALGRETTGTAQERASKGQTLFFKPGVWDEFHDDACNRHNRRSKCPVKVDGYKRQLWSNLGATDQKTWNAQCAVEEGHDAPGMACLKLLVFIGHYDETMNCFVVTKMGKKTNFDTFGEVLATLPPYIEQCDELWLGTTTEHVYGLPFIRIPCMLGSNYCHTVLKGMEPRMDSGIVMNGTCDKVVILQQQLGANRVFQFRQASNQVIAEVRSAHIGKRRSTSAFRLVISSPEKDGAYILLPFLKRASGTDVRVHIVDFIRLLWEYNIFEDPDLEHVNWHVFCAIIQQLVQQRSVSSKVVVVRHKTHAPLRVLRFLTQTTNSKMARCIWNMVRTVAIQIPTQLPTTTSTKKRGLKESKHHTHSRKVGTTPWVLKMTRTILAMLGRRTIRSVDVATSVLDLSFFGLCSEGDPIKRLERYLEIRSFLQNTCTPDNFTKSAGQILTGLALEGARERTIHAQRSYVLNNVLRSELFPHLGSTSSVKMRRYKLFYAVSQVFAPLFDFYTGRTQWPSDKDSMGNKRLDMFDEIIGIYFRQQSQSNRGTLAKMIQKELNAGVHVDSKLIHGLVANKRFENSIRYPFNTGKTKLSDKRPGTKKQSQNGSGGVQQTTGNMMARISHLRRVRHAHVNSDNKAIQPRMVHSKDTRRLCPGESPEGTMVGLLKNIALLSYVSTGIVTTDELEILLHCLVPPSWIWPLDEMRSAVDVRYTVTINGVIKAFVQPRKMRDLCDFLRNCRRAGNLRFDISIYLAEHGTTLYLDSSAGRMMDPLVTTDSITSGRFFQVWEAFLANGGQFSNLIWNMSQVGCIDYVCANEESEYWIATSWADWFAQLEEHRLNGSPMFTHIMIHAVALVDYSIASMIFPECNQGPRNTYQAKMLTQAISMPDQITRQSTEGTKYWLNYGQAPLVHSSVCMFDGLRKFSSGVNCVVQMKRHGITEDALVFNQGSIDRGLFHITYNMNMILETEKHQTIEVPNMRTCRNIKQADYSKLDPKTGIIRVGSYVSADDVMVGLTSKVTNFSRGGKVKIDVSLIYARKIPARVTEIMHTTNRFGNPLIHFTLLASNKELPFPMEALKSLGNPESTKRKVSGCELPPSSTSSKKTRGRWVSTRPQGISIPAHGEKFASRSAQKGVIGYIVPEADMDFVCEGPNTGMRADICFNPDGIPSRMTMGSPMVEMLLGVLACVLGVQIDGTPFSMTDNDLGDIRRQLAQAGQNEFCEEQMCSGTTGERIRGEDHLPDFLKVGDISSRPRRGCVMGIIYYQRLAHFVATKIHSRNGGPLNPFTRQPTNGRAKKGGLRMGTMEVDALVGHGGAALLRERMLLASDNHYAPMCCVCKLMGETARDGKYFCRNCGLPGTCEMVQIPYAAKMMIHLYQSAGLTWQMSLES